MPNRASNLVATQIEEQSKEARPSRPLIGPHGKERGGWELMTGVVSGGEGKCGAKRPTKPQAPPSSKCYDRQLMSGIFALIYGSTCLDQLGDRSTPLSRSN